MGDTYDLIIVGAGTAGCVLSERLTQSGKLRVLVLEAGGPPRNRFISIPAGMTKLFKSEVDWAYESEPQTSIGGRRVFTPRGKMLGGSSNMNAQMHQWCHPADFDGWVAAGASGWGWNDVVSVFRAQERWLGEDADPGRGRQGPMTISPNRNARPLSHAFVDAARQAGLGGARLYNGHAYQGAWIAELAHKDGKRFSAYDAYLVPAMRRANLEVMTDAHATKVVIDRGRAAGVTVRRGGHVETLTAGGVVLAAGAFASPQLLMMSGVGPASVLAQFELPVHVDRRQVGENLQDHPASGIVFRTHGPDTLKSAESPLNLLRYILFKRGMLASGGVEGFAFTQVGSGPVAAPDLEIMFLPGERRDQFLEPPREHAFTIAAAVVAPRSRGRLSLRSPDPLVAPAIDFGLLSDPDGLDASVLCKGLRLTRRIANTSPLAAHNMGELQPGASIESDRDLLTFANTDIQTVYHPTSTCRMGSDQGAVVDAELRVRGVESLWVADASVMPSVPRGHPNAVVAMIAERAARWVEAAMLR
ncbi:MAG: GMC family oxidoreductase N-terminal domain-containing protein [Dechloromonas sp.]|nr:GMC family oxidoreductase N-terminal domain-containing protein [Dechloromonas sp.]